MKSKLLTVVLAGVTLCGVAGMAQAAQGASWDSKLGQIVLHSGVKGSKVIVTAHVPNGQLGSLTLGGGEPSRSKMISGTGDLKVAIKCTPTSDGFGWEAILKIPGKDDQVHVVSLGCR
jgi:hypothetical protein